MTQELSELRRIADRYARFAAEEARGSSDVYERLALAVAGSPDVLRFLATLPLEKQQPNLFLGAMRYLFGVPGSEGQLTDLVRQQPDRIRQCMLSRTTQTNEPARCAVLLPLLAKLPQPLALLEVGASAGLCLLPDRYGYDYGVAALDPPQQGPCTPPVFKCRVSGGAPIPRALPNVAWRCGIDLHPIDVASTTDTAWLETLVWPGQQQRAETLRAAIAVAQADPPKVVRGNLLSDLAALTAQAPNDAALVVFHTAALAYVPSLADRERFAQEVGRSRAVWISNEVPAAFPDMTRAAPAPPRSGLFLLAINGKAVAWTGPHGQSIDWFGEPDL